MPEGLKMSLVKYWERRWHCSINGGDEKENSALGEGELIGLSRLVRRRAEELLVWDKPSKL